ncbi:glycosyltransferase family 2 protein [Lichenicoccus sp.]|uniref:glycosyltransferase family 2 protein n=1 Tax=Lichenicoccus sp. TaxID=2781899 RepID=UPI003D12BC9F
MDTIAATIEDDLAAVRGLISPRFNPPPTPLGSRLIHAGALLLWVVLLGRAFLGGGVFAWSAGIAYILYDTALLLFVFAQTLGLRHGPAPIEPTGLPPSATIIVAAHNEAASLPVTLAALFAQSDPADVILIADDGSTDTTASLLEREYGLVAVPGAVSRPSALYPTLRWLRLPRGGKAQALNVACAMIDTDLVLTVDADTLLDPPALRAMRAAFADDPDLVAATGVLKPLCGPSLRGRLLQWFQTYEYVRNFLSRYAWMRADGLLLISGAFACYRRRALLAVGGFDPDCLVEDYELTHRLRDHAGRTGQTWHTAVIGAAHARTDAPSTPGAFLRQRRRWFGGFLQTQLWYRHMVGNPRYGHTGTAMLPVKAIDTLQPLYGLTGAVLLVVYLVEGRFGLVGPVLVIIAAKIALDVAFHLWSLRLYRRWVGPNAALAVGPALLASLLEPFSFQLLRHFGAALGWVSFATRTKTWQVQQRLGVGSVR